MLFVLEAYVVRETTGRIRKQTVGNNGPIWTVRRRRGLQLVTGQRSPLNDDRGQATLQARRKLGHRGRDMPDKWSAVGKFEKSRIASVQVKDKLAFGRTVTVGAGDDGHDVRRHGSGFQVEHNDTASDEVVPDQEVSLMVCMQLGGSAVGGKSAR